MLKVRGLNVLHPAGAEIIDVSLTVPKGQITAVIGPNDGGKSLLGRVIADPYIEHSGEIIAGHVNRAHDAEQAANQLGYSPAEPALEDYLTGFEQIDYVAALFGLAPRERTKKAIELAKDFNLGGDIYRLIELLGGSSRKKISLCCSLVHDPAVIVWDEPTGQLDPTDQQVIHRRLERLKNDKASILLITNDLTLAETADEIIVFADGKIKMSGNLSQLKNQTNCQTKDLAEIFARAIDRDG